MQLDKTFPFAFFCDVTSSEDVPHAIKEQALLTLKEAIQSRLEEIKNRNFTESFLKEALLFANVKLMQAISPKWSLAASALIIARKEKQNGIHLILAGIGGFRAYSIDEDFTEALFQDPLNTEAHLKNALGKISEPQFHIRKIERTSLKGILITSSNGKQNETLLFEPESKAQEKSLKSNALIPVTFALVCLSLSFFLFFTFPHKTHVAFSAQPKPVLIEDDGMFKDFENALHSKEARIVALTAENEHLKGKLSTAPKPQMQEAAKVEFTPPKPQQRIHIVSGGESLSTISQMYYGTSKHWEDIFEANEELLSSKNQIKAGMRLVVP